MSALVRRVRRELEEGSGIAWVQGYREGGEAWARRVFGVIARDLAKDCGLRVGRPLAGAPQARTFRPASDGAMAFQTVGADAFAPPKHVGLLRVGAGAPPRDVVVSSALLAHERLRVRNPAVLRRLYEDEDEGTASSAPTCRAVFAIHEGSLRVRYDRALLDPSVAASDALTGRDLDELDACLGDDGVFVRFRLEPGDMLWVHNRVLMLGMPATESDRHEGAGGGADEWVWLESQAD